MCWISSRAVDRSATPALVLSTRRADQRQQQHRDRQPRRDRDGVWVHDLCTDPDVRRQGLGREMVLRCTRRLLDGGLGRAETSVSLEVRTDNAAAVATYARCAFETVRTDTMLELPLEAFIAVFTQTSMDTPA